jgi:hypothetical protein
MTRITQLLVAAAVGAVSYVPLSGAQPVLESSTQKFIDVLAAQGGKPIYQLSVPESSAAVPSADHGLRRAAADAAIFTRQTRSIPSSNRFGSGDLV